jgi:hypothetical protein
MTIPQPGQLSKVYTGITLASENDVTFSTSVSGYRFLYNGSQFGLLEYNTSTNFSEMNLWNSDGTRATNFIFKHPYLLDANYDSDEGVYYGIRWNNEVAYQGNGPFGSLTETEGGVESASLLLKAEFNQAETWETELRISTRYYSDVSWCCGQETSDTWYNYQYSYINGGNHDSAFNTASLDLFQLSGGNLTYSSTTGVGHYLFDVDVNDNFVAFMDINLTSFSGTDSVIGMRCLGQGTNSADPYNQLATVCFRGPNDGSEKVQGWLVSYPSASAGNKWTLSNLRINERYLDDDNGSKVYGIADGTNGTFNIQVDSLTTATYWDGDIWYCGSPGYTTLVKRLPEVYAYKYTGTIGLWSPASVNLGDSQVSSSSKPYNEDNVVYNIPGSNCYDALSGYDEDEGVLTEIVTATTFPAVSRFFPFTGIDETPGSANKVMSYDIKVGYSRDEQNQSYTNYFDGTANGSSRAVNVKMDKEAVGIDSDKLRLAIKRVGSTLYMMKRDNTIAGGAYSVINSSDINYTGPVKFELYADGVGSPTNEVEISQFVVRDLFTSEQTGDGADGSTNFTSPVFTVETYDQDGNPVAVAGISDSSGHVIRSLDIIKDIPEGGGAFGNFYDNVQIATDSTTYSGEVYINVNTDMYKYLKSALPITTVESGSSASIITYGSMYGTPYRNTLNFNGYTLAGISFIGANVADPGSGLYVNTLRNETMTANVPFKFAWIESSDATFKLYATDFNTPSVVYGLSTSDMKVYLYDLDEYKSAFSNVVFQKQILAANTGEVTTVAAQVLNVYGSPLSGKTVQFSVSEGDGSVSPASSVTDALGEATTTYTVGATVGTARVTVIVAN